MIGETNVGVAECRVVGAPGVLACSALGSCVGVCLWDRQLRLCGLLHVLLPYVGVRNANPVPAKYADTGIYQLVDEMECLGAERGRLLAKLVGGASLYRGERDLTAIRIGERNVEAARAVLARLNIPIIGEHVGGGYGRSLRVDADSFAVQVTVLGQNIVTI